MLISSIPLPLKKNYLNACISGSLMRLQQPVRIVASAPAELYKGSRCPGPRRLSCNFHTGSGGGGGKKVSCIVCRVSHVVCVCPSFPPITPRGCQGQDPTAQSPPERGAEPPPAPGRFFWGSPHRIFALYSRSPPRRPAPPAPHRRRDILGRFCAALLFPLPCPHPGGVPGRHSPWELP